jgi:hypothetical protein
MTAKEKKVAKQAKKDTKGLLTPNM